MATVRLILVWWVGPATGKDECGKSPLGFNPRTIQPVACRCTDGIIPDRLIGIHKQSCRYT